MLNIGTKNIDTIYFIVSSSSFIVSDPLPGRLVSSLFKNGYFENNIKKVFTKVFKKYLNTSMYLVFKYILQKYLVFSI